MSAQAQMKTPIMIDVQLKTYCIGLKLIINSRASQTYQHGKYIFIHYIPRIIYNYVFSNCMHVNLKNKVRMEYDKINESCFSYQFQTQVQCTTDLQYRKTLRVT